MPEGTLILATRDGVVVDVVDSHTEGGNDVRLLTQANDVGILHCNGTIATYAHLMSSCVAVQIGQNVKSGEIIGYSVSTGFSGGPHLHFQVTKLVESNGDISDVSIPTTFYVGKPILSFAPQYGMCVTANYISSISPVQLFQADNTVAATKPEAHPVIGNAASDVTESSMIRISNIEVTNWMNLPGF